MQEGMLVELPLLSISCSLHAIPEIRHHITLGHRLGRADFDVQLLVHRSRAFIEPMCRLGAGRYLCFCLELHSSSFAVERPSSLQYSQNSLLWNIRLTIAASRTYQVTDRAG